VFVDLDETLCDFSEGLAALFAADALPGADTGSIPTSVKWRRMEQAKGFFSNLPWLEDGEHLWRNLGPLGPCVLTGAAAEWSVPQKREWCARNLGLVETLNVNEYSRDTAKPNDGRFSRVPPGTVVTARTSTKHLFAGPNKILIDDLEETGRRWTQAGGVFILRTPGNADEVLARLVHLGALRREDLVERGVARAQVYVALDGVLADFSRAVREEFGTPEGDLNPGDSVVFPRISNMPGFFSNLPWTGDGRHREPARREAKRASERAKRASERSERASEAKREEESGGSGGAATTDASAGGKSGRTNNLRRQRGREERAHQQPPPSLTLASFFSLRSRTLASPSCARLRSPLTLAQCGRTWRRCSRASCPACRAPGPSRRSCRGARSAWACRTTWTRRRTASRRRATRSSTRVG
jgi:hypothetical protein